MQATSLNMIYMVGIGPFVVIPFVIQSMGGPQCLLAWVAGALLALFDGCIWAELGAAMPEAGGSYVFLREGYGREGWGRLMSFMYIWQTLFLHPDNPQVFGPLGRFGIWISTFPGNWPAILIAACLSYYVVEQPALRARVRIIRTFHLYADRRRNRTLQ